MAYTSTGCSEGVKKNDFLLWSVFIQLVSSPSYVEILKRRVVQIRIYINIKKISYEKSLL